MSDSKDNKNIARTMMLGLIYPAVLGSILYSFVGIIIEGSYAGVKTGFLLQSDYEILIKAILFLTTLAFYGCDYVYSCWVSIYKKQFFILDLLVLSALYLTTIGVNITSTKQPAFTLISLCYFFVILCYFVWDFFEHSRQQYKRFFKLMRVWQIFGMVLMFLFLIMTKFLLLTPDLQAMTLPVLLLVLTAWFWWLLYQKRKLLAY